MKSSNDPILPRNYTKGFYFEGAAVTYVTLWLCVCVNVCVCLLCSPLSSPLRSGMPPGCAPPGRTAAAAAAAAAGGGGIRFLRAAPPGPLEAANDAWSKRLPSLLWIRSHKKWNYERLIVESGAPERMRGFRTSPVFWIILQVWILYRPSTKPLVNISIWESFSLF